MSAPEIGSAVTVRGFVVADTHRMRFWTCERDGYEIHALDDESEGASSAQPFFARVTLYGVDFGAANGASVEEAIENALALVDVGARRIGAHIAPDAEVFKKDLVAKAMEAYERAHGELRPGEVDCQREVFVREIAERMAQSAQFLAFAAPIVLEPADTSRDEIGGAR